MISSRQGGPRAQRRFVTKGGPLSAASPGSTAVAGLRMSLSVERVRSGSSDAQLTASCRWRLIEVGRCGCALRAAAILWGAGNAPLNDVQEVRMRGPVLHALSLVAGIIGGITLALAPVVAAGPTGWPQWGQNPQHQGFVSDAGQSLSRALADIVYDPNVPAEQAASGGDLLAHYQAPLLHGNDVFMEFKSGPFTDPDHWNTQTWHERRFHWEGSPAQLVQKWDFATDWKPEPNGPDNGQSSKQDRLGLGGWEPVFHAVLANDFIYVPSVNGTIVKLATGDGSLVSSINPAYPAAANTKNFVAGPLSADSSGNVYFNAIQLNDTDPWGGTSGTDVSDSWLVKVAPDDSAQKVSYKSL